MHMRVMDIREAQRDLLSLLRGLAAGDEIVLTEGKTQIASIVASGAKPSLRDIKPASVGKLLRDYPGDDDLLGEMLGPV